MCNFTICDVKLLRDKTGYGLIDCRKALDATDGDQEKAIEWLKENINIPSLSKQTGRSELMQKYIDILHNAGFKEVNVDIVYSPDKSPQYDKVNTSLLISEDYIFYTDGIIGKGIYDVCNTQYPDHSRSKSEPLVSVGRTVLIREAHWLIIYHKKSDSAAIRINIMKDDEMGIVPEVIKFLNESVLQKEPNNETCVKITTLENNIKKAEFCSYIISEW